MIRGDKRKIRADLYHTFYLFQLVNVLICIQGRLIVCKCVSYHKSVLECNRINTLLENMLSEFNALVSVSGSRN